MLNINDFNNDVFNNNDFIDEIFEEIIENEIEDDFTDHLHQKIDKLVDSFDDDENINVITVFSGGIFEAIKLNNGNFDLPKNSHLFYAKLASVSIYYKYYDIINERLKDTEI